MTMHATAVPLDSKSRIVALHRQVWSVQTADDRWAAEVILEDGQISVVVNLARRMTPADARGLADGLTVAAAIAERGV